MNVATVCVTPSLVVRLVIIFCIVWPFVALALIARRGRSSVPLTAMLIGIAVGECGTWLGLIRVARVMAIAGPPFGAAVAAGMAEALTLLVGGVVSAAFVALAALVRRHRPVADRGAIVLALVVIANGIVATRQIIPNVPVAIAGAVTALLAAVGGLVWLLLVGRGRVTSRPLPRLAFALCAAIAILGFLAWRQAEAFAMFARG